MILDSHTHMPSPGWPGHKSYFDSVSDAVAYLRDTGTDAAIFNTWQGVLSATEEDLNTANKAALALGREFEGFLYPGAVIHPSFPEASREWLARFRNEGILWVGELVNSKESTCNYMERPFLELFEECAKHGHIVQLHADEDVIELAKRFPEMQVVFSHIATGLCPRIAAQPNIWQDISGRVGGLQIGGVEAAYESLGVGRLLYGTDFTGYEPRAFMARVRAVIHAPEEQSQVFAGNLIRLLAQAGARPIC